MIHLKTFETYNSQIDDILDKINTTGIDSLSDEELQILKNGDINPKEDENINDYNDDDDDDVYFKQSDLEEMVESDDNNDDFEPDWLKRREEARKLYNINNETPQGVLLHFQKVMEYIEDPENPDIFKNKLIDLFIDKLGILIENIYEKTRRKEVVRPRQLIMYVLREDFNISFPSIGQKLGGRDHTTVIHSCDKIRTELKTDSVLSQELNQIRAMM
jgi:hypothetical protein